MLNLTARRKQSNNIFQSNPVVIFLDAVLSSYSTIFFINNRWLGLILLLATFNMPFIGLCGLIGVIIAIITARLLKFSLAQDNSGYYTFNSLLVSLAIAYFYPLSASNYLIFFSILVFGSIITVILSVAFSQYFYYHLALPSLSLAFVVITIFIFFVFHQSSEPLAIIKSHPLLINWTASLQGWFALYFRSMGSILFQPNLVAGIIIAIVLLIHSRISFLLSIIGFCVGYTFLTAFVNFTEFEIMLMGFNTILTAIAIGGIFFIPSIISFIIAAIGSVAGIIIGIGFQNALHSFHIPPLAIPFNIVVLAVLYAFKARIKNTSPFLVDFQTGSPEANLEYYYSRIARFYNEGQPQFYLPFNGIWTVTQGPDDEPTHKHNWREAWDFEVLDEHGLRFTNSGKELKDYFCYDKPVLAVANGTVVKVVNWIEDNPIKTINTRDNWGNLVVVAHAPRIHSLLCHLKQNSVRVNVGDMVKAGDTIASCGNSGRSFVPHLHFHIQTTPEPGSPTVKSDIINYIRADKHPHKFIHFGRPQKNEQISALRQESRLQEVLKLQVKNTLIFKVTDNSGMSHNEQWTIDIDFWGNLIIESSCGAKAYFMVNNGIFSIVKFSGNNQCALYTLALSMPSFPYADEQDLTWHDRPPISSVLPVVIRIIQDIFDFITRPLNFHGQYHSINESDGSINIQGKINLRLAKMSIYSWQTNCKFHPEQGITSLELFIKNKQKIRAELKN